MKPFDLQKALKGAKVVNENGVKGITVFKLPVPYTAGGRYLPYYMQFSDGSGHAIDRDGRGVEPSSRLYMESNPVTYYVNLEKDSDCYYKHITATSAIASSRMGRQYLAIAVPITVEE